MLPRRHSKGVIQSKNDAVRSIYLRLKAHQTNADKRILVSRALRVSNDLCWSCILSTFEMARGFTRLAVSAPAADLEPVLDALIEAHRSRSQPSAS